PDLWGNLWGKSKAPFGALCKLLRRMAGATGLEPPAPAVAVLSRGRQAATPNKTALYRTLVFMGVCRIFPALRLCLSDILRHRPIPVGMTGLRHKSRHILGDDPSSREGGTGF